MRRAVSGVLLGLAVLLAGCASAPPIAPPLRGSPEADEAMKHFPVSQSGMAHVFIYRNTRHGKDAPLELTLDGEVVGTLPAYSYMPLAVSPGVHELRARFREQAGLTLNLQAGRNYYVQLNFELGATIGKPEMVNMQRLEAESSVRGECALVLPTRHRIAP